MQEKKDLKKKNRQLRDENNKTKDGCSRPVIKKPAKRDLSGKGREKGNGKEAHKDRPAGYNIHTTTALPGIRYAINLRKLFTFNLCKAQFFAVVQETIY
jgi:hypothetical protein